MVLIEGSSRPLRLASYVGFLTLSIAMAFLATMVAWFFVRGTAPAEDDHRFGTVGAVALDRAGHLAAGTSTGGMMGNQSDVFQGTGNGTAFIMQIGDNNTSYVDQQTQACCSQPIATSRTTSSSRSVSGSTTLFSCFLKRFDMSFLVIDESSADLP